MQSLELTSGAFRTVAVEILNRSGIVASIEEKNRGDFGTSLEAVQFLETARDAVDLGLHFAEHTGIAPRIINAISWVAFANRFKSVAVEEPMDADGIVEILDRDPADFFHTVFRIHAAYVRTTDPDPVAFVALFSDALTRTPFLVDAVESFAQNHLVFFDGISFRGFHERPKSPTELLPVSPDQIVGNDDYLQRGLRLARDVAAFDLESRKNPKRINPVLFGLGKPGCGKTISAHAVGNYFLDFCEQRGIRSQFRTVRRTDWASSYQNASAANLVELFEQAKSFDGVTGFYWPDIDTAFASRSDQGLRSEEKQNLGAAFGIFDGTLLPKDGSWFLICDANTMHMDPATVSRIAQQPCHVSGPSTADDYVRLMRDILLKDVIDFLPTDSWDAFGERCIELLLSGRNAESIANNIIAKVQDFEFPDRYYSANVEERKSIALSLYQNVSWEEMFEELERWANFHADADEDAEQEAFNSEVEQIVRRLNAHAVATGEFK